MVAQKKKKNRQTKNGENVPSFKVVELVLFQCNLIGNQYQRKSEVAYIFLPNKSYSYLLNVEPKNLVFLKTYNTEFDNMTTTFTDQNVRTLQVEDKVNLTLFINKQR